MRAPIVSKASPSYGSPLYRLCCVRPVGRRDLRRVYDPENHASAADSLMLALWSPKGQAIPFRRLYRRGGGAGAAAPLSLLRMPGEILWAAFLR